MKKLSIVNFYINNFLRQLSAGKAREFSLRNRPVTNRVEIDFSNAIKKLLIAFTDRNLSWERFQLKLSKFYQAHFSKFQSNHIKPYHSI